MEDECDDLNDMDENLDEEQQDQYEKCKFPQGPCNACKRNEFANKTPVRTLFGNDTPECCYGKEHSAYIFEDRCKVLCILDTTTYFLVKLPNL